MDKKLWALLYHDTSEYSLPEVLAVSEYPERLRELAKKDAIECFGKEYIEARFWQGEDGESQSFDDDYDQAEYFIVEVSFGLVI